ncbi:hypothetical protein DVH24_019704 [Malus domestica]|uniref:BED-type domain-containing protein n=1 Tax=Malus domestica TaxID=3750 RepID=A0A498HZN2_MALDO|nr:hypothetical protein DVH24_019704 [Malus domestica]
MFNVIYYFIFLTIFKVIPDPFQSLNTKASIFKMSSKRDPAWEHGDPIDGNKHGTICKYCGRVMKSGGVTRLKYHLSGLDPSKNVQRCDNVPLIGAYLCALVS